MEKGTSTDGAKEGASPHQYIRSVLPLCLPCHFHVSLDVIAGDIVTIEYKSSIEGDTGAETPVDVRALPWRSSPCAQLCIGSSAMITS